MSIRLDLFGNPPTLKSGVERLDKRPKVPVIVPLLVKGLQVLSLKLLDHIVLVGRRQLCVETRSVLQLKSQFGIVQRILQKRNSSMNRENP